MFFTPGNPQMSGNYFYSCDLSEKFTKWRFRYFMRFQENQTPEKPIRLHSVWYKKRSKDRNSHSKSSSSPRFNFAAANSLNAC